MIGGGGGGLKKEKEGGGGGYLRGRLNREFMVYYLSLNYMYSTCFAVNAINNMQSL